MDRREARASKQNNRQKGQSHLPTIDKRAQLAVEHVIATVNAFETLRTFKINPIFVRRKLFKIFSFRDSKLHAYVSVHVCAPYMCVGQQLSHVVEIRIFRWLLMYFIGLVWASHKKTRVFPIESYRRECQVNVTWSDTTAARMLNEEGRTKDAQDAVRRISEIMYYAGGFCL